MKPDVLSQIVVICHWMVAIEALKHWLMSLVAKS